MEPNNIVLSGKGLDLVVYPILPSGNPAMLSNPSLNYEKFSPPSGDPTAVFFSQVSTLLGLAAAAPSGSISSVFPNKDTKYE